MKKVFKSQQSPWRREELLNHPKDQVLILSDGELRQVSGGRGRVYQIILAE